MPLPQQPARFTQRRTGATSEAQANDSPSNTYQASKTFAEKPKFILSVINSPVVLGPIIHNLTSLDVLNTSNQRIRDLIPGAVKKQCLPTGNHLFVDVCDLGLVHVLVVEKVEASGKRFFTVLSHFSLKEIVAIIGEEFPQYQDRLLASDAFKPGDYPADGVYRFDNSRVREALRVKLWPEGEYF